MIKKQAIWLLLWFLFLQGWGVFASNVSAGSAQEKSSQTANRLITEDSPYLRQHAHNPVDWYPWGVEAFAQAKAQNKPIFLSIGYATCHWCHVMARESFENPKIAAVLNRHFIAIKVDRERRPDLDEAYLRAIRILAGRGGWPISIFLTPDGKAFAGDIYYPPEEFLALLKQIGLQWKKPQERVLLLAQAEKIADQQEEKSTNSESDLKLNQQTIDTAIEAILAQYDDFQGGFGDAPKYPHEPKLLLLLNELSRVGKNQNPARRAEMLDAVETTLQAMLQGGIYDQIGGGFHRYAIDYEWLVPHFEKMLYNQARLAQVYLLAWQLTGKLEYKRVATQTLDFVLRDLAALEGGFFSAMDADSDGGEGRFFVWKPQEMDAVLLPDFSPEMTRWIKEYYDVTPEGNFEGHSILHVPVSAVKFAHQHGWTLEEFHQKLDTAREKLRIAREKRPHPLRDEKILTAWNGMMIASLAQSARALNRADYLRAATRTAERIWQQSRDADGNLQRSLFRGNASVPAMLEDYAFYGVGLLHLYDVSREPKWLQRAHQLADQMLARFWDKKRGGFFTSLEAESFSGLNHLKDSGLDHIIPSSGSAAALKLLQMLVLRINHFQFHQKADELLHYFSVSVAKNTKPFSSLLTAANDFWNGENHSYGYAAQGGVFVSALLSPLHPKQQSNQKNNQINKISKEKYSLIVEIEIADGWHINSYQVLQKNLVPTSLYVGQAWKMGAVYWPVPDSVQTEFLDNPLLLYHGKVKIETTLTKRKNSHSSDENGLEIIPLQIKLQACSDKICLPPETLTLSLYPP